MTTEAEAGAMDPQAAGHPSPPGAGTREERSRPGSECERAPPTACFGISSSQSRERMSVCRFPLPRLQSRLTLERMRAGVQGDGERHTRPVVTACARREVSPSGW